MFEVTLANGHILYPLAETLEDAIVMASCDSLRSGWDGKIAKVKDDNQAEYVDIKISVDYNVAIDIK